MTNFRTRRLLFPIQLAASTLSFPFVLSNPVQQQQPQLSSAPATTSSSLLPVYDLGQEHVEIPPFITPAPTPPVQALAGISRPDAINDLLRRQEGDDLGCKNLCGADAGTTYSCAYFGSGYGICCPVSTFCEPRTACIAYTDHTVSGLTGPSINSEQTMLCGADGPVCYTGTWEYGVSYGEDLTMAHCVGEGRVESEYFGCTRWTSSAYCLGETSTTEDPSTSSETSSTSSETNPSSSEAEDVTIITRSGSSDPDPTQTGDGEDSGGLSTGAVAGIAVGTGLGCVALAIVGFLIWRNKHSKSKNQTTTPPPPPPPVPAPAPAYYPPAQDPYAPGPPPPLSPAPMGYHPQQQPLIPGYGPGQHTSYYEPGQYPNQSPPMNPVDTQKTVYTELPAGK